MFYALEYNETTGSIRSTHIYGEEPTALPSNEIACTQAQSETPAKWRVVNGALVAYTPPAPTLAEAQTAQAKIIKADCAAAILEGFTSSALGSAHTYPSDQVTQVNVAMAVAAGGNLWCETGGAWAFISHTAAQAGQVQKDMFAMIQGAQTKYSTLLSQIDSATSVSAVNAVVWE